ncbi:hypothetical protein D3C74_465050 [compost metagenome]
MDIPQQPEEIAEEPGGANRSAEWIGYKAVHLLRITAQPVKGGSHRGKGPVIWTKHNPIQQNTPVAHPLQPELQSRQ